MKFILEINCDNAAFSDNGLAEETEWVLAGLSARVREGESFGNLKDSNGNTVGSFKFTDN